MEIVKYISCLLLLGVLLENAEGSYTTPNCPKLTGFNGRIKYRRRGSRAVFKCKRNEERYGPRVLNCRQDGTWDGEMPVCIKSGCVPVDISQSEYLDMTEEYGGALLKFSCEASYQLLGAKESYCDGYSWNNPLPKCIATSDLTECDFEKDLCGWTQDDTDQGDWVRNAGSTPTGNTGPKFDHTHMNQSTGHYLFFEASNPTSMNDQARLVSPEYSADMSPMCFDFWYHILGPQDDGHVGSLEVFVQGRSEFVNDLQPLFYKEGNQGDTWLRGEIVIDERTEPYQIVIEATKKLSYISDIAIDDLRLFNCTEDTTTSTPSTTPSTTTTSTSITTQASTTTTTTIVPIETKMTATTSTTPELRTSKTSASPSTKQTSKMISNPSTKPPVSTVKTSTSTSSTYKSTAVSSTKGPSTSSNTPSKTPISTAKLSSISTSAKSVSGSAKSSMNTVPSSKPTLTSSKMVHSTLQQSTEVSTTTKISSSTTGPTTKKSTTPTTRKSTSPPSTTRQYTKSPILSTTPSSIVTSPTSLDTSTTAVKSRSTKGSTRAPTPATIKPTTNMVTSKTSTLKPKTKPVTTSKVTAQTSSSATKTTSSVSEKTPSSTKLTPIITKSSSSRTSSKSGLSTNKTMASASTSPPQITEKVSSTTGQTIVSAAKPKSTPTPSATVVSQNRTNPPSVSVAVQKASEHPADDTLKPLMIGLGVGIIAGLIIIGVIAYVCVRRRKFYTSRYEDELKPITNAASTQSINNVQYYPDDEYDN